MAVTRGKTAAELVPAGYSIRTQQLQAADRVLLTAFNYKLNRLPAAHLLSLSLRSNMVQKASRVDISALRHALQNKQWTGVRKQLSAVQTSLPAHAGGLEIATSLDTVREVSDVLVEVCSFHTAFETAYEARRGLLRAGVCEWAVKVLGGFRVFLPVVERVASVLGLLGIGTEERSQVGKSGAVDLLTTLWRDNPMCLEIVSTLASLCAGHIDNVSRTMRQRGLVVAMDLLNNPDSVAHHDLVSKTLLLVGQCAICTPDNPQEADAMVPALLTMLERLTEAGLPQIVEHAICALANITDCWLKESYGYTIPNYDHLVTKIMEAWSAFPRSRNLASCISRSLLSLMSIHEGATSAVLAASEVLLGLLDGCRLKSTTTQALAHEIKRENIARSNVDESDVETSPVTIPGTPLSKSEKDNFPIFSEDEDLDHDAVKPKRKRRASVGSKHQAKSAPTARSTRATKQSEFHEESGPPVKKRCRSYTNRSKKNRGNADSDVELISAPIRKGLGESAPSRSISARYPCETRLALPESETGVINLCSSDDDALPSSARLRELALKNRIVAPKKRIRRPSRKRTVDL